MYILFVTLKLIYSSVRESRYFPNRHFVQIGSVHMPLFVYKCFDASIINAQTLLIYAKPNRFQNNLTIASIQTLPFFRFSQEPKALFYYIYPISPRDEFAPLAQPESYFSIFFSNLQLFISYLFFSVCVYAFIQCVGFLCACMSRTIPTIVLYDFR